MTTLKMQCGKTVEIESPDETGRVYQYVYVDGVLVACVSYNGAARV